jgi:hypothetical protein
VKALVALEAAVKKPTFGCRLCGQCVLHDLGMTCPMNCPKTLRNGPCGGVREDGRCEVKPSMECVWVKAERRSRTLPFLPASWRAHFHELRPPVDRLLVGTSSWANLVTGRDRVRPAGWQAAGEEPE